MVFNCVHYETHEQFSSEKYFSASQLISGLTSAEKVLQNLPPKERPMRLIRLFMMNALQLIR